MARFRGISRSCLWWCWLLCVLSVDAYAAKKNVSVPSAYGLAKGSSEVSRVGNNIRINGPLQGEFIPHSANKSLSLKVKPSADYSIGRIINQAKPLVRGGFAGALFGAGFMWAMEQIPGATYDPVTGELIKSDTQGALSGVPSTGHYAWSVQGSTKKAFSPSEACRLEFPKGSSLMHHSSSPPTYFQVDSYIIEPASETQVSCYLMPSNSSLGYIQVRSVIRTGESCPDGSTYSSSNQSCSFVSSSPFTDSDYDALFAGMASHPDPNWIRDVLLKSCQNAPNPETCADGLQEFKNNLMGPSTVDAGTTTTTSNYVKPDGTVGTKSSVTNTKYNISYGPTSFTYNQTSTTQHYTDGQLTGEDTVVDQDSDSVEDPAETPEQQPEEQEDEQPQPCSTNCDGPAYEDMYEPTDKTKEDELDDFSTRVSNIPVISALTNYFSVSVPSTACPVWSYTGSVAIYDVSMPINLTFDYLCVDWFVALKSYIQIVILFVFTILAVRVGLE